MKPAKKLIYILIIVTILISIPAFSASATQSGLAYGAATVDVPVLNLREGPSTSHNVLTRLSSGDIVVILERTSSTWFYVNFHGTVGYVSAEFLRDVLTAENFSALGRVVGSRVNIRSRPNTTSSSLGSYSEFTVMTVIGINNGWYKVVHDNHTGYIRSDLMEIVSGYRPSAPIAAAVTSGIPHANPSLGMEIADYALTYLGTRYVWGGASPSGFDCSGLVTYVHKHFDISVSRTASGQHRDNGVIIDKSDLFPGDLVFFAANGRNISHVGICIGNDEFVHASTSDTGVIISRLDSAYYTRVWHSAKRLI